MAQKSASTKRLQVTGKEHHEGQPTVQGAKDFSRKMQSMEERWDPDYVRLKDQKYNNESNRDGAQGDYPVRLYPRDRYDNVAALKAAIPQDEQGKTIWGDKVLTTDDLNYIERKQEAQQQAYYKQFLAGLFNQKNPAEAKILQKIHPEILQEREGIVETRKEMMLRLAKMRARGFPESREDLELIFAIKSGRIRPPKGNLWRPDSWDDATLGSPQEALARGWFSPFVIKNTKLSKTSPYDLIPNDPSNPYLDEMRMGTASSISTSDAVQSMKNTISNFGMGRAAPSAAVLPSSSGSTLGGPSSQSPQSPLLFY